MFFRALLQVSVAAVLALWTSSGLAAGPLRITGRVLAPDVSGIPGARVELLPAYEGPTRPEPLASARTDGEGSFEIAAPESGCFRLVVRAEGHLPMQHLLLPLVEDRELSPATLLPSQSLEVRTVGPDGQPAAGVEVRIAFRDPWGLAGADRPLGWHLAVRSGVSGPDGKVVLPVYQNENPEVAALSSRFQEQRVTASPPSALLRLSPARETTSKPVPPRRISGKVADSLSGKPVAGALVWSGWPLVAPPARADGEGRFQLDILGGPPGEGIWLESGAAGFLPAERQYVRPGAAEPVLLKLDPAAMIAGVVVDPADKPVAGARVAIDRSRIGEMLEAFLENREVRSGAEGRFRLTGLRPGGTYDLVVTREGFASTSLRVLTAPAGKPSPSLRIILGLGQTASGRIVDEDGEPVAGAHLMLIAPLGVEGGQTATTNEDGRFEVPRLSPGKLLLIAAHPAYSPLQLPDVEIPPGTPTVDLGDLVLPASTAIEGRVVDTLGRPVENAKIQVTETPEIDGIDSVSFSGFGMSTDSFLMGPDGFLTGPDGSFRLPGLRRGDRFDLHVTHPSYAAVSLPGVEAPTKEPVQIEMRAGHAVSGQVVNAEGKPVAGASLIWQQRDEGFGGLAHASEPLAVTDPEGGFRAEGLAPGSLTLRVNADGYQTRWLDDFRIPDEGDVEDVRIVLQQGSWLDVRVLNAEGEPVRGTQVFANPPEPREQAAPRALWLRSLGLCQTDAQGRCRLDLPEPGPYQVTAGRGSWATLDVNAGPGGTPVELRLPPGFAVSGRVIGEDGAGVPGLYVQVQGDKIQFGGQTEVDGSFLFPNLAPGRYRLAVDQPGTGKGSVDVEIAGRPVRDVELRISRPDSSTTLSGRLLGVSPEELAGTRVWTDTAVGRVERDGRYSIDGLEPGEWIVRARTAAGRKVERRVHIEAGSPAATLDLDFTAGLTLAGRVLVDEAPLAGATVHASNGQPTSPFRMVQTSFDGSFTLRDLEPGDWRLVISGSGGRGAIRPFRLEESAEVVIEITTGTFKATVLSAAGEPLEDAVATLEAWEPTLQMSFAAVTARSGPDGTLDAGRLAPGTYRMEVRKEGFQPRQETVEIRPGGGTVMEVRLAPRE